MTHVLSAYRPWLAAAILSSTVALSACGGGGGSNSFQDTPPNNDSTQPGPGPGQGAHRPDLDSDNPGSGENAEPDAPIVGPPIEADGSLVLVWSPPTERENGEPLYDTELGGYKIRFRHIDQEDYETITIENSLAEFYEFDNLVGTYYFQIAAYDTDGLYSKFVNIRPME